MPRIDSHQVERNKTVIEEAALRCFVKNGYNGVSVREIADAAGTSLGNLYNYYPDKLSLFKAVLAKQMADFSSANNPIQKYIDTCDFPNDLEKLAMAVDWATDKYKDYFKLTYIDVVEFDGQLVSRLFSDVAGRFEARMGDHFDEIGPLGPKKIDPAFSFVASYLLFYYFFVLKKLFRSTKIYGDRSDNEVIQQLSELLLYGIAKPMTRGKKPQ